MPSLAARDQNKTLRLISERRRIYDVAGRSVWERRRRDDDAVSQPSDVLHRISAAETSCRNCQYLLAIHKSGLFSDVLELQRVDHLKNWEESRCSRAAKGGPSQETGRSLDD